MTFFICYDITDDRLRTRLTKHLEKAGSRRIQKSVFVAHDFDKKEITNLKATVQKILRGASATRPTDSILYIPIESDYFPQVVWQGDQAMWENILEKTYVKVL